MISSVNNLKNNKAVGLDNVSSEMLKTALPVISKILKNIFNVILSTGRYPKMWNMGYITSLCKKGSYLDASIYRGLTINGTLGKVFNSILNSRREKFVYSLFDGYCTVNMLQLALY